MHIPFYHIHLYGDRLHSWVALAYTLWWQRKDTNPEVGGSVSNTLSSRKTLSGRDVVSCLAAQVGPGELSNTECCSPRDQQGRADAFETSSASSSRQATNKWLVKSLSGLSLITGYLSI